MNSNTQHSGIHGYVFAFLSSVLLTLAAYFSVTKKIFVGQSLICAIVVLGIVQVIIQLVFFLYLGKEKRPRSNLLVFLFMILILSIVIIGTFWIMYSLNDRLMPTMEM
jgi:cytochrome o ubiquinol oxidase operon protein cyoD